MKADHAPTRGPRPKPPSIRLQKYLSECGVCSRREAEEWIRQGRVLINGLPAHLGRKIDPATDAVTADGRRVEPTRKIYILLHKPRGVFSTRKDTHGRPTVVDLVADATPGQAPGYLYPVGRLDGDSEGLMLLTNDGELAYRLTHPRFGVEKVYRVLADRLLADSVLERLRRGVVIDDGPTGPASVRPLQSRARAPWYEITIREGRNRQVRRMFGVVGARVLKLVRVRLGPFRLAGLAPGDYRVLSRQQVERLLKECNARPRVLSR